MKALMLPCDSYLDYIEIMIGRRLLRSPLQIDIRLTELFKAVLCGRMEKLTAEVKAAREAQSEAQQTAAAASAKADVLQQAVAQVLLLLLLLLLLQ
jgi:hypothetical protein